MAFKFIDLFCGIGGTRQAFEVHGAECVFSSDIDRFACQTYEANFGEYPAGDITQIPSEDIPEHDILVAGFPCQPFSIAGVSKLNGLGREHGFRDQSRGTLFFEIVRIAEHRKPAALLLENVKNLKSHDRGRTWQVIEGALEEAGYRVFSAVVDGAHWVPQHRERVYIVALRQDLFSDTVFEFPTPPAERGIRLADLLQPEVADKYTLSDKLWAYLKEYKERHAKRGNGFGFGLVDPAVDDQTRTLSARYYKDGSEILIKQADKNPRRLTPRECARLMGFSDDFIIPVSDTQAYKQFGNSVVVPAVAAIAGELLPLLEESKVERVNG